MRVLSFVIPFVIPFVTLDPVPLASGDPAAVGPIRFERLAEGGIVVPVTIDGRGPFRFLLDTGASHSALSAALASDLALSPEAKTLVTTPAGETWRAVVRVRSLRVGSAFAAEIWPSVFERGRLEAGRQVDGVLGQDVLGGFRYTLDYRRRTLEWGGAQRTDAEGSRLRLEWAGGCPIVATEPAGGRRGLRLIADSGASHVVLFDRGDGALPPYRDVEPQVRLTTLEGERPVRPVTIPELRVGGIVLRNESAAVVEAGGHRADGVLPLHRFDRVTFDGHYLWVERR
jgi:predicted aspartyl protease